MKKTIRLTESDLHKIVKESVKRVLRESRTHKDRRVIKEGGHLYWKDDEGNAHTNSKELYRGVNGAILVSHGEWADPEIIYKKHSINYYDVEELLWSRYKEFCEENGIEPSTDNFDKYVDEYEDVEGALDDCVWALDGNP